MGRRLGRRVKPGIVALTALGCRSRVRASVFGLLRDPLAEVAELVDAHGSGPCLGNQVEVQVLSSAPTNANPTPLGAGFFYLAGAHGSTEYLDSHKKADHRGENDDPRSAVLCARGEHRGHRQTLLHSDDTTPTH